MKLKNRVQLIGNLGDDPIIRTTEAGATMASMSIATNESFFKDGKKVEETQWHRLVAFGKAAETAENYLKKGTELIVQGKLVHRSYEKDGEKKYITEIVVSEFLMLGRPSTQDKAA